VKKVRIRELPDWPPQPGGAYDASTVFPTGGEATIAEVFPMRDRTVTFRGDFHGRHSYHYKAQTAKVAQQVYDIVAASIGGTVASLGEHEIEIES